MASQLPKLHSIPKNDPWNSILIYQTRIFCKKNGSKSSILPEIEVQTFYYPLYAVTTACCVPRQIPVRNMREHSREICYTTRGTTRYYTGCSNLNFHSRASLRHTLRLELSWAGPMFGNVSSPSNLSLPILVKSPQLGLSLICFIISTSSQGPKIAKASGPRDVICLTLPHWNSRRLDKFAICASLHN